MRPTFPAHLILLHEISLTWRTVQLVQLITDLSQHSCIQSFLNPYILFSTPFPNASMLSSSLRVHTNTNRRMQIIVHSGLMVFKGGDECQANRQLRYLLQQHYHSVTSNCTKQAGEYEPRLRSVELPSTGHHLNLAPYLSYTATRSKKKNLLPRLLLPNSPIAKFHLNARCTSQGHNA
jgi:hypothetical protein